jgi:uncharacterized protein YndB with AHSA1/START domain
MSEDTTAQAAEEMQQITITRVFDAPLEAVFKAWTDPDQVARWFGPAGMETPRDSVEIDLRVGGRFKLRMIRPGSEMEHPIDYEVVDFKEPELLVLRSEPMPDFGLHHGTVARIELSDENGKTRMTLTDGPYAVDAGRGAGAGWEGAFDKMEALLAGSA